MADETSSKGKAPATDEISTAEETPTNQGGSAGEEIPAKEKASAVAKQPIDHYAILGIRRDASVRQIRAAYVTSVQHVNANKNSRDAQPSSSNDAEGNSIDTASQLQAAKEAYTILNSPTTRREYDQQLGRQSTGPEQAATSSSRPMMDPAVESMFAGVRRRSAERRRSHQEGTDRQRRVLIDIDRCVEDLRGLKEEISSAGYLAVADCGPSFDTQHASRAFPPEIPPIVPHHEDPLNNNSSPNPPLLPRNSVIPDVIWTPQRSRFNSLSQIESADDSVSSSNLNRNRNARNRNSVRWAANLEAPPSGSYASLLLRYEDLERNRFLGIRRPHEDNNDFRRVRRRVTVLR